MSKWLAAVGALAVCLAGIGCSPNQDSSTSSATPATSAAASNAAQPPAAAAAEPNYPQPVVVMPPRPKPGAPHGPGFDMPLIDIEGQHPARPVDVVKDAHIFTADHPEVASYVPCYCGCGNAGHKNNADCFIRARDAEGRVAEWDPHGVTCAVCIDIAVDSMRMRNSGASVMAIRKKVQGDYRPHFPNSETPTPAPIQGK